MLIKNLNTSNIFIKYSKLYNYYKLYYYCEYIKLNGIIINIKINNYKRYNNLYYVYLSSLKNYFLFLRIYVYHHIRSFSVKYTNVLNYLLYKFFKK